MWEIVRGLVAAESTILLTTQYLDEADQLADRIAVLDGGTIVAEGTPAELKRLVPGGRIQLEFDDTAAWIAEPRSPPRRSMRVAKVDIPHDGRLGSLGDHGSARPGRHRRARFSASTPPTSTMCFSRSRGIPRRPHRAQMMPRRR